MTYIFFDGRTRHDEIKISDNILTTVQRDELNFNYCLIFLIICKLIMFVQDAKGTSKPPKRNFRGTKHHLAPPKGPDEKKIELEVNLFQ